MLTCSPSLLDGYSSAAVTALLVDRAEHMNNRARSSAKNTLHAASRHLHWPLCCVSSHSGKPDAFESLCPDIDVKLSAWPSALMWKCLCRGSEQVTQRQLSRMSVASTASAASVYFDAQEVLPDNPSDSETGAVLFPDPCWATACVAVPRRPRG